jgi:hypothetical protein
MIGMTRTFAGRRERGKFFLPQVLDKEGNKKINRYTKLRRYENLIVNHDTSDFGICSFILTVRVQRGNENTKMM